MAERGVQEVNLIAQDTTMYGRDLRRGYQLEDLLEKLIQIRAFPGSASFTATPRESRTGSWNSWSRHLLFVPYLDIPIQHVDPGILRAMGRGMDGAKVWQLIEKIRSKNERISLRTTVMVGFPGETEAAFKRLVGVRERR